MPEICIYAYLIIYVSFLIHVDLYVSYRDVFYRATLCISAVLAVGRCLSVYHSHSCTVSKRLKISSNVLLFW